MPILLLAPTLNPNRNVGKKTLEYLPDVYENLSRRIKNKKLKKIFDSDNNKKIGQIWIQLWTKLE